MSRSNETRASFLHQVFNMNAPVPPAADGQIDSLKQPGQFPSGYGSGFSSQAEGSAEQPDISQDSLQSGESRAEPRGVQQLHMNLSFIRTTCTPRAQQGATLPTPWDSWCGSIRPRRISGCDPKPSVQPLYRVTATMQSP